jgi:MFS family permease
VTQVRLGLRANARQFGLLVALTGFVGAMVGLERSVLPLVGEREFDVDSSVAILSFVAAFGVAKAGANLAAGGLADRVGRKPLLVGGWLLALPVAPLIALAPGWGAVVVANVFLGASQGFAWSMAVLMKIDLVGPRRRGVALGLNESAGYLGLAVAAGATGALAGTFAPRSVVWVGAALVAGAGTLLSVRTVRDTRAHVALEQRDHAGPARTSLRRAFVHGTLNHPVLRSCSQAGLVNNLNDALVWGLVPLYLASRGASVAKIGIVAGLYPAVWGAGQLVTGWASDLVGRRPLIVSGMLVQAAGLGVLLGDASFASALVAATLLGVGTALVYPTLIAAVSDAVQPVERAAAVGVYRFWRDVGFVVGALVTGVVADAFGAGAAIAVVAALTAASGVWVALARPGPATRAAPGAAPPQARPDAFRSPSAESRPR